MREYGIVSIIVPVYNVEKYLEQCLNSIVNQTYSHLQIILVDDGSKDSSGSICDQWAMRDSRITVLHKQNGGLSGARNDGLRLASGEYCCFVDSDDWLDLDAVEKAVAAAETYKAEIVFFPYFRESNAKTLEVHFFEKSCFFSEEAVRKQLVRKLIGPIGKELISPEKMDRCSTAWAKLFRTSVITENAIKFTDLSEIGTFEDGLFNIPVFFRASSVYYLDECMYHYRRMYSGQLTSAYDPKFFERTEHLYSILENLPEVDATENGREALQNRIALGISSQALSIAGASGDFLWKRKMLHSILHSERYESALRALSIQGMPFHWKTFFLACKFRSDTAVFVLADLMRRIKDWRNK